MPKSPEEIFDAIFANARRFPGSIALASRNGYMNYADLVGNIASAAEAAARGGIRPGQLVVPVVANPDMELILVLALMRIGCRVGFTIDLRLYEASGVAVDAVVADPHSAQGIRRPVVPVTPDWFKGAGADMQGLSSAPAEFSLVFTSSGSTGRPKLIEMSPQRLVVAVAQRDYTPTIRMLPLFGQRTSNNFHDSIATLAVGGVVIRPADVKSPTILDTIQLFRPNHIGLAPLLLADLIHTLKAYPADIQKVGVLRTGGARCAPELRRAALEQLAESYLSYYGSVETGWTVGGSFDDLQMIDNTAGKILDGADVAAFDAEGRKLPPGMEGAIRTKAPEGAVGRYIGTAATETSAFKDGWFSTGDIGLIDANRNLILRGRASNVINVGGSKVSPEEVEELILMLDKVVEVGVTGIAVPEGYEAVCAAVVGTAPVSIDELNAHLGQQDFLHSVQLVKNVAEIPKTYNGKIDRQALKRLLM